jgi:hypothetical protein
MLPFLRGEKMARRKGKTIIQDKKLRGEWAESVFMERATEHGLPVSKPWGEMCSYDFVIGKTGRFTSVQVKSTISEFKTGYDCTVRGGHKAYPPGSFDFLAAYAVIDDAWYIIPAEVIRGKKSITLFPKSKTAKYEQYREAWHLLRQAAAVEDEKESAGGSIESEAGETSLISEPTTQPANFPTGALGRMEAAGNFFKRYLERGSAGPRKESDEV